MSQPVPPRPLLVSLTSMMVTACIPMVGVGLNDRQNLGDKIPEFIVAGKTTKADVFLALGEPDVESNTELRYTRDTNSGVIFFVYTVPLFLESSTHRSLAIYFDDVGLVTNAVFERRSCSQREFLGPSVSIKCVNEATNILVPR